MRDCLGIIEQSSKKASDYQQKGAVPYYAPKKSLIAINLFCE
jgi:hypothetical protein